MTKLLVRNKPTSLICTGNPEYEIDWDRDEIVFQINADKRQRDYLEDMGIPLNDMIGEILVWSRSFDFSTVYVARSEDFDVVEDYGLKY
jgi:hypothetical protein